MNWGDWRPPESQSSLIQSLSHFGSCDTRSHDNQVGGQSGYLFDQGNIPHMPASNLEIKEGMQTCNSSLESCDKLLLDHLKTKKKTTSLHNQPSKAVFAPNLMKTQRFIFSGTPCDLSAPEVEPGSSFLGAVVHVMCPGITCRHTVGPDPLPHNLPASVTASDLLWMSRQI